MTGKVKRLWYVLVGWWNAGSGYCAVRTQNPRYCDRWLVYGPFATAYRAAVVCNKITPEHLRRVEYWQDMGRKWEFNSPCWREPRCICNSEFNFLCPVYHSER